MKSSCEIVDCGEDCACWNLETLGFFSYEKMTWESECPNRKKRIECNHDHPCSNMKIKSGKRKKLKEDVIEKLCWGMDFYTFENIFWMLPMDESTDLKYSFIQHNLKKAINVQVFNIF